MNFILRILIILLFCIAFVGAGVVVFWNQTPVVFYEVNNEKQEIGMMTPKGVRGWYISDAKKILKSSGESPALIMNAGMFDIDFKPVGLYSENYVTKKPLITVKRGDGNFFLGEHGIFYIDWENVAHVESTTAVKDSLREIKTASQSGPMLLIDKKINEKFKIGSQNKEMRNGVCITDKNNVLFAISRVRINLYDFALAFKQKNCVNALYLDGKISRAIIPGRLMWGDGIVGPIVYITEK